MYNIGTNKNAENFKQNPCEFATASIHYTVVGMTFCQTRKHHMRAPLFFKFFSM